MFVQAIRRGVEVIVATPGRLIDLMNVSILFLKIPGMTGTEIALRIELLIIRDKGIR